MVGLGRTGVAASGWLADHGVRVYASDADGRPELRDVAEKLRAKSVVVDVGLHDLQRIKECAAVVVSPGVPPNAPPIVAAHAAGVEVVSELDLAARILTDSKLIVVTGTNGKTTTTALIAHLLRAAGRSAEAAGNIGRPLIALADGSTPLEWVVVEASSFQLHDSPSLAPAIGVLTNLAPDHLDRYQSVDAYYADKQCLFRNATAASIWMLNGDDAGVLQLAKDAAGERRRWSTRAAADAWWNRSSNKMIVGDREVADRAELPLLGDHNVENALAALLVVAAVGVDVTAMGRALETFSPLPHRLERVRDIHGVLWINDSKATNVASTRVALDAMDRPFVLIAGGQDKGESFEPLAPLLGNCRQMIVYGATAKKFQQQLGNTVHLIVVDSLESAVRLAVDNAQSGEQVLLSPACPSFDQFRNFEARGDEFKRLVGNL